MLARTIRLADEQQVRIVDPTYQLEAKQLEYELGETGRLGRLWAPGPGRLHARADGRRGELQATWEQEVRLRPHENNPVLSLIRGSVTVDTEQHFSADEMHLFLVEVAENGSDGGYGVAPDRLKAVGNVKLESPRLTAAVREGNLWFDREADSTVQSSAAQPGHTSWVDGWHRRPWEKRLRRQTAKYDLQADVLQAQILLGDRPQVRRLTLQTNIHFRQVHGDTSQALSLEGEVLEIQDAHTATARAVLVGGPARVSAGEMQLEGGEFRLAQAENALDVVGPGTMIMPPPKTTSRPLPPMQVGWQGGMRFNGRSAFFNRQVNLQGSSVQPNGDVVKLQGTSDSFRVTLDAIHRVRPTARPPDRSMCPSWRLTPMCSCRARHSTPAGQLKAFQRTEARNLLINQSTGDLRGEGPGWISSVHRREAGSKQPFPGSPLGSSPSGIEYMRIRFLREVVGNLHKGEIAFHERVKTVYGPVAAWDQTLDESRSPGPEDSFVVLTSDRLAVSDMSSQAGALKDVELEATGNAFVLGGNFSADAQRISYVRGKDQVIAEGDGRNEATITVPTGAIQRRPGRAESGQNPLLSEHQTVRIERRAISRSTQYQSAPCPHPKAVTRKSLPSVPFLSSLECNGTGSARVPGRNIACGVQQHWQSQCHTN